jgi:hypothetical protein
MNPRRAIVVATFACLVSGNALAQTQPTCPKGFQPYANRCISQRMADYISCVEASGGNSERIALEVSNANAGKTDVGVQGSGSGVIAKGSGSITVDRATEKALASKFEHTWTDKGMEECRKVLDPPKPPHKSSSTPPNSNQTGGTAIAMNGIAIAGPATVNNPTVNNFGPPPLPTPTVKVCVTPSKQKSSELFETKITLKSDVQITRPWFFFFFDGPVENGTAQMERGVFGCNCPMRAEKLPNPERSFGFRTTSINMGSNIWYPNNEPISVTVPSKTSVNLMRVLAGGGDNDDVSLPENLVFTCDNVGSENQTAPTAVAPNGIAVSGGIVSNPTVNNVTALPDVTMSNEQEKKVSDSIGDLFAGAEVTVTAVQPDQNTRDVSDRLTRVLKSKGASVEYDSVQMYLPAEGMTLHKGVSITSFPSERKTAVDTLVAALGDAGIVKVVPIYDHRDSKIGIVVNRSADTREEAQQY